MTCLPLPALGLLMKIGLLAAAIALATVACGAYSFPGGEASPTPSLGSVAGRVLAQPCAPVEQAGSPCAGRPVPNLELDYLVGTAVLAHAVTRADGSYAVALSPGSYTVRMKTYMRVISGPLQLTVAAGSNVVANYIVDSGIRVPAPQQ